MPRSASGSTVSISRHTEKLHRRVVRTVDELSPGTAELVTATGANFNYGPEFLRGYELFPIQPVHGCYYVELFDPDGAVAAFAPCYVQGDPLGALGLVGSTLPDAVTAGLDSVAVRNCASASFA